MSEVLNVSVTTDARELFAEYDVDTIKKIKSCAINEIGQKHNVLKQFIGDNYHPLLNTPPVLKDIQKIFDEVKDTLNKLSSYGSDFGSINVINETPKPSPYFTISNSYIESIRCLDNHEFMKSFEAYKIAKSVEVSENSIQIQAINSGLNFIPSRIFTRICDFIQNPSNKLTPDSISDSYYTLEKLHQCDAKTFKDPTIIISESLKTRVIQSSVVSIQITEICSSFMTLMECLILFLASTQTKMSISLISDLVSSFRNSISDQLDKFKGLDLREIFRFSKLVEDLTRNRLASPRMASGLSEIGLKINFWEMAFLPIFQGLSSVSVSSSISSLSIISRLESLLSSKSVESFNCSSFSLSTNSTLKARSLGVSPLITDLQSDIEKLMLSITSQIQSQSSTIASINMIRKPLDQELIKASEFLDEAINESPLCVFHICNALSSPSVISLLSDNDSQSINSITEVQEKSAYEWASRKSAELESFLTKISTPGASFSYLVACERELLAAGGHLLNTKLASSLRARVKISTTDFIQKKLEGLQITSNFEARTAAESQAASLFFDYCLFETVLGMQPNPAIRTMFINKMDPTKFNQIETNTQISIEALLSNSVELIKLMSGRRPLTSIQNSIPFNVNQTIERLFQ